MTLGFSFLLKKFISFLLMPMTLGMGLTLLGLWHLYRNNISKAKYYLLIGIGWIFLISSAFFADFIIAPLEHRYHRLYSIPKSVQYILILGGDKKHRAWEVMRLYHAIPHAKIITSGYSMHDKHSEATKVRTLLIKSGIKKEDILIQERVKDTEEEAQAIRHRLGEKPFILVTSAYHMPRAMKIFEKAGLKPIPAPTDYYTPNNEEKYALLKGKQLRKVEAAWHEYIGLLWLEIKD